MPAFFDPTLAQTVGGGFIQEDKIDDALRQLIHRRWLVWHSTEPARLLGLPKEG